VRIAQLDNSNGRPRHYWSNGSESSGRGVRCSKTAISDNVPGPASVLGSVEPVCGLRLRMTPTAEVSTNAGERYCKHARDRPKTCRRFMYPRPASDRSGCRQQRDNVLQSSANVSPSRTTIEFRHGGFHVLGENMGFENVPS
jgi:hypothetical protein